MKAEELGVLSGLSNNLFGLNQNLGRLVSLVEWAMPVGEKQLSRNVGSTATEISFDPPLISFILHNDSSSEGVYYAVNNEQKLMDAVLIKAGKSHEVNYIYPTIFQLWLKAESTTVEVRLFGYEGKRNEALLETYISYLLKQ